MNGKEGASVEIRDLCLSKVSIIFWLSRFQLSDAVIAIA